MASSPATPSLPVALSQMLLAFTIEFDNEFEHRVPQPHRGPARGGVWLASMAMWSNFVRLVPDSGVPLADLQPNAAITNLAGLQRWGYLSIDGDADGGGTVRLKPGGRRACATR